MKYAVEMVSGAMIQIPSFTRIGSAIQKLFFQNKENGLKTESFCCF
jgi:hypothetical protein